MRFTTILPALFLALSACATAPHTYVQQPPAPETAPAKKVEVVPVVVPAPTPVVNSQQQTFSDKAWEITVPSSFVRSPNVGNGNFGANDDAHGMAVVLAVIEFPGNLADVATAIRMSLVKGGAEIEEFRPGTLAGFDAILFTASVKLGEGKVLHIESWSALSQGHLYNLGCLVLPNAADGPTALKVCETVAASVKLTPLPAPTNSK